jgi:hypothetical protein
MMDLQKLQDLYEKTTKGEWEFKETFAFNTHVSKKQIMGGGEKERLRLALLTKVADGQFMVEVHKAWPEISALLSNL